MHSIASSLGTNTYRYTRYRYIVYIYFKKKKTPLRGIDLRHRGVHEHVSRAPHNAIRNEVGSR